MVAWLVVFFHQGSLVIDLFLSNDLVLPSEPVCSTEYEVDGQSTKVAGE